MPVYSATAPCTSIFPGDTASVIDAESLAVGQASQRLAVASPYGRSAATVSVLLAFSADPGVFDVRVQQADVDAEANYLDVPAAASITAVDAVNFTARADFAPFLGKFIRIKMQDDPANAVTLTAKVSR